MRIRHEISRVMGLTGKPKGTSLILPSRKERSTSPPSTPADYCESDFVGTYQVWLRYELFRGTLSQNAFEASERSLAEFMNARLSIKNSL